MKSPPRVVCYARVSTTSQADKNGVAAQLHAIRQRAEAAGWTIGDEFIDEGYSGRMADRPALARLLRVVRARKVDIVVIYSLDRMARSVQHLLTLLGDFEDRGVRLVSVTEELDTASAVGRAMLQVRAVFAEMEAAIASERIRAGMAAAQARGTRIGRARKLDHAAAVAAVAEAGSLRGAARKLGVGTSTVQRALERGDVGVEL